MTVAGITGTDGKTTTSTMLWAAWPAAGERAARRHHRGRPDRRRESGRAPAGITTLEATELQRLLAEAAAAGCTRVALETSSHGLHLHRVDDVDYDIAVYTRITSEHLDIHGSREEYLRTKQRLLELVGERPRGLAVLDRDDDFAYPQPRRHAGGAPAHLQRRRSRRRRPRRRGPAMLRTEVSISRRPRRGDGSRWSCAWPAPSTRPTRWRRWPRACGGGVALETAVRGIAGLERVIGRMERVDLGQDFGVVVDYAHTAAALETVLGELRPATRGRLWVVFGSAGERDREKRGPMGGIAARLADVVVVTDEDPRGEDRVGILEEIGRAAEAAGATRGDRLHLIPDRTEAIGFAIERRPAG